MTKIGSNHKRILRVISLLFFSFFINPTYLSAQCVSGGMWQNFTPTCTGAAQLITSAGYAGEYDAVNLTAGVYYKFDCSAQTDIITITDNANSILAWGIASVIFKPTVSGVYRFYDHTTSCGSQFVNRSRFISCNFTPQPCITSPYGQYPAAVFTPICTLGDQIITTAAFAGDYSMVSLTSNQIITFKSSLTTDVITITNGNASTIFVCALGQVTFTAPYSGQFRFYTHLSGCGTAAVSRTRSVSVPAPIVPSISISASSTSICAGTSVTFTATATNGGSAPSYQWIVDGNNVGTNSNVYTTTSLTNGAKVSCRMSPNNFCQTANTVNSNNIVITVTTPIVPSVTISADQTTICTGNTISFTASPVNGGFFPSYQWKIGGANVGTNSNTYSTASIANGEVVTCVMTATNTCQNPSVVTSNPITVSVFPIVTPAVSITSSTNNVCAGQNVDFTAVTTNGGLYPDIKWYVNGFQMQNSPSTTFSTTTLQNNDVVTCSIMAYENCLTTSTASSNSITMTIKPAPSVTITGNNCTGSTLTAIVDTLSTTSISWYLNQSLISQPIGTYKPQPKPAGSNAVGSALNQLNDPQGMAVDASGALYIADQNNHRVVKYLPGATSGIIVAGTGVAGTALNQLNQPEQLFIDVHDNLYIYDRLNDRIMKYAPGSSSGVIVAGGNGYGLALNQIYFLGGFYVTPNGDVYLAQTAKVIKWTPGATSGVLVAGTGVSGHTSTQIAFLTSIYIDSAGNIYLSDCDGASLNTTVARIVKFPPGSNVCTTVAGGFASGTSNSQFNYPTDIGMNTDGDLIVFDYFNDRIVKWTPGAASGTTIITNNHVCNIGGGWCAARKMFFDRKSNNIFISTFYDDIKKWSLIVPQSVTATAPGDYSAVVTNINGCSSTSATVTVNDPSPPELYLGGNTNEVCEGTLVTVYAQVVNGGPSPIFVWYKNNAQVFFNSSNTYASSTLHYGDVIKCYVYTNSTCQSTNVAVDSMTAYIYPNVTPTVSIATTTNPCVGGPLIFNASTTHGGPYPYFRWYVNNIDQNHNSASFTLSNPHAGDQVYCSMTGSEFCMTTSLVNSNNITIQSYVTPSINISSNNYNSCFGDTIHYVANATNGGPSPNYLWSVNGIPTSFTGPQFNSSTLTNESLVSCTMTANNVCQTTSIVNSNSIPALVNYCNGITLKMFIQGFYTGNMKMNPVLYNDGLSSDPHDVDTITVALHDQFEPSLTSFEEKVILKDTGFAEVNFDNLPYNSSYYISIKHRNSIETWSNLPIQMKNKVKFSFSTELFEGVKDVDGNVYDTIRIGNQVWFKSNLNTSKYRNGINIPNASSVSDWTNSSLTQKGAWCYYNNDSSENALYGKIYNWYTVNDTALCPAGWHVPTTNDWTILSNYLGGNTVAGGKLKETGLTHYNFQNVDATNSSGFTGVPAGGRSESFPNILFSARGNLGFWWESNSIAYNTIQSFNGQFVRYVELPLTKAGRSVRCIKD